MTNSSSAPTLKICSKDDYAPTTETLFISAMDVESDVMMFTTQGTGTSITGTGAPSSLVRINL